MSMSSDQISKSIDLLSSVTECLIVLLREHARTTMIYEAPLPPRPPINDNDVPF